MRTAAGLPMVAMLVTLLVGCSSDRSDDATAASSSTTPSSTTSTPTPTPRTPPPGPVVPFRDYLESINVTAQPLPIAEATGIEVTVPVPTGWARASDPIFATGLEFIRPLSGAGGDPSATLMAIRLTGDFDPNDAIRHANVDALPPRATDATESFDDYQGLPSALTEGFSDGSEHYSRFVIATTSAGQHYLVQLGVTTPRTKPIAQTPELTSIIDGFSVKVT